MFKNIIFGRKYFIIVLYNQITEVCFTFPKHKPVTQTEKVLNFNFRGDQIVNGVLILILVLMYCARWNRKYKKVSMAKSILNKVNKKSRKWAQEEQGVECAICMEVYTYDSQVI